MVVTDGLRRYAEQSISSGIRNNNPKKAKWESWLEK